MKKKDKILVITPRLPFPVIGGDKLRIYNICNELQKQGKKLTLISFVTDDQETQTAINAPENIIFEEVLTVKLPTYQSVFNCLFRLFNSRPLQVNYYHSRKMKSLIDDTFKKRHFDSILVHLIRMAPYVDEYEINKVLEMTDAISLNYSRNAQFESTSILGLLYKFDRKRVLNYELSCVKNFDSTVLVSDIDKEYISNHLVQDTRNSLFTIPNGVSEDFLLSKNNHEGVDKNLIIFIGNLKTHQNNDAILYFIKEIWPLIKKERKETCLKVIGANPSRSLRSYHQENGIEITGKVKSVINEAQSAALSVAPIRIGAGIQNKVLESMALGIPVVCSKIAAEGIPGIPEQLICNTEKEFAAKVLDILTKPYLRKELSITSINIIEKHYSWENQLNRLSEIL